MSDTPKSGDGTLAYYSGNAEAYAAREVSGRNRHFIETFARDIAPGGAILDLGCGAGWAASMFERMGYDAHACDGCPELAAIASRKLKRPARVVRLEDIDDASIYDGIFANAVLHHLPKDAIPGAMARISRALKPGGRLFASFKQGEGEHADKVGRFYSYCMPQELERLVEATPGLAFDRIETQEGLDFTGEPQVFLGVYAHRTA
ncbi:MAG: class I SAM-dependent methyltransferase [Hyphomicrobiales bacterium]